jgi:hypothetical protein
MQDGLYEHYKPYLEALDGDGMPAIREWQRIEFNDCVQGVY